MSFFKKTVQLTLFLMILSAKAYNPHEGCSHYAKNIEIEDPPLIEVEEESLPDKRLLSTQTYPKIRMTVNYDNLIEGSDEFKAYIRSELVPLIVDYFQAALAVKQPLTGKLKLASTTKTICGYTTPSALLTGVTTDFYLIVSSTYDSSSNWIASAGSCALSGTNKRPLVAQMLFNTYYTKPTTDPLIHEKNMYLTLHEMIHALGFTGSSFKNFIDNSGNTLTGHIKSVVLDGQTRTVLDVEPLTSKLRTHFGCSTLEGAFMENDGGSGTAGSHFERRHFLNEVMTSGVIQGLRISEFSLALLEGSGWYMPNYTYADSFYIGQGQGCGFLYTSCSSNAILNYDEFCETTSSRACAGVGVAGGVCSSDSRSDGCKYYIPVIEYHCESPDAIDYARLPTKETYSRTAGSKCFNGNLTTKTSGTATSMCFKYTCSGSGLNTTVQVSIGTTSVTCKSEGQISVSGYNGKLKCPDPLTFCNTIGKKGCPRNCMGRGTCVNNQCVCNTGYTGIDCAMNA